jgi:hypothetical protein
VSDHPPVTTQQMANASFVAMAILEELNGAGASSSGTDDLGCEPFSDDQIRLIFRIGGNAALNVLHAIDNAVRDEWVESYVHLVLKAARPDVRPSELTARYLAVYGRPIDHQHCRRCCRSIVFDGYRWTHLAADGGLNVGCRAASFTDEDGWDESLDRDGRRNPTTS